MITPQDEFEWEQAKKEVFDRQRKERLVAWSALFRGDNSFLDLQTYDEQKAWIDKRISC